MRRGVVNVLRRGLDNAVANWPLAVFRFGETMLFAIIAFATALAILLPILVSMGLALSDASDPEDVFRVLMALGQKWTVLFWIFVLVSVLLLLFVALHSFVEAGRARVFVQTDRAAGPASGGPRSRFAAPSMQEWVRGGALGWWPVFCRGR